MYKHIYIERERAFLQFLTQTHRHTHTHKHTHTPTEIHTERKRQREERREERREKREERREERSARVYDEAMQCLFNTSNYLIRSTSLCNLSLSLSFLSLSFSFSLSLFSSGTGDSTLCDSCGGKVQAVTDTFNDLSPVWYGAMRQDAR